jgi:hypothetical protein
VGLEKEYIKVKQEHDEATQKVEWMHHEFERVYQDFPEAHAEKEAPMEE